MTLSRAVLGRAARRRTFRITPETKIEGELRLKCRATVAFVNSEQGEVAKRIIVRSHRKQASGLRVEK